jgi:hypothetical protein
MEVWLPVCVSLAEGWQDPGGAQGDIWSRKISAAEGSRRKIRGGKQRILCCVSWRKYYGRCRLVVVVVPPHEAFGSSEWICFSPER